MPDTPVDLVVCCVTGDIQVSDVPPEQVAADAAAGQAILAAQEQAATRRATDLDVVAASTDPTIQALARLLGA